MKRKKLLRAVLVGVLLVGAVSPFKAVAQTWTDVTSTYLTNAELTSSTGWTRTGSWDDTNISSGVSEAYGGWDSNTNNSYSCKQTVTLPKGVYRLTGYAFYRSQQVYNTDPNVSLASIVAGSVKREITTLASPSRSSYPNNRSDAATAFYTDNDYLNTLYFTVAENGTSVSVGYEGTHNSSQSKSWFIAGAMKLYKLDINSVSSSTPLDIAVINSGFDVCVNGWAYTTGAPNHGYATNQSGDISGGYFENWKWESYTGAIHQSVNVPNGSYTIKAAAFRDQLITDASDGDAVYVYANNDQTLVTAAKGTYYTVNATVTDEGLDFGVKSTVAKYRWMGIDNTTIQCKGIQLSYADALPSTDVTPDKWYAIPIPATGDYVISSSATTASLTYTQDGTQIASNVTSTDNVSISAGSNEILSLNIGSLFVKSNVATTINIEASSFNFTAGQNITSLITNPGFESNGAVVNLSENNLTGITGWTLATAERTNDVGTRAYSDGTFATLNGVGDYCFNCYWEGKPLTQEIGPLPAGTYELSALVTTGNGNSMGTVYLNAGTFHSTGLTRKSANANYYQREKLLFTLTSPQKITIGIRGGDNPDNGASKGAYNENGYWWYKCDDFQLTYLFKPTQANLHNKLQTLITDCAPWTNSGEYYSNYQIYSAYTASNTVAELTAAINYLTNEYERHALASATNSRPYDMNLIANPSYSDGQTSWSDNRSATGSGSISIASDNTQTNYFNSSFNTWMHHSDVYQEGIIVDEGIYRLSAKMKGTPKDDESTFIYATTGNVNYWGTLFSGTTYNSYLTKAAASSWSTIDIYLALDAPAKFRIGAYSWGNNWNGGNGGAFSVDDWKLEKIDYAVVTNNAVVSAYGAAPLANINAALTQDVAAVDLTKATGLSSAAISTSNNANLLIHANSGQVSNSDNVVVDGTCANLVLVDGYPFVNPKEFTATSATYTMGAVADNKFGTLIIPFPASTLPGSAYTLDQGVDLMDGNIRGTSVSSIPANSPVLVKASGNYTGSSVTVPVVTQGATYTNGELVGTYTAMEAPANSYVLQNHTSGEGVAFYLVGTTKPTVNPFRAYIKSQGSGARALHVVFDDEAQGITNLNLNDNINEKECYDLMGRKLNGQSRGIGIVRMSNGTVKKVYVK